MHYTDIGLVLAGLIVGIPLGACLQYYKRIIDIIFKTHKNKI